MPGDDGGTPSSGDAEVDGSTGVGSGGAEGGTTEHGADGASSSSVGPSDDDATTMDPYVDPCEDPAPFTVEIEVMEPLLAEPMQLDMSDTEGPYAYSEVAGQGRASFQFQLPCPAVVHAWGRVYDPGVGVSAIDLTDPDSFLVSFDGENPVAWWYGCQMVDVAPFGGAWGWQPMLDNDWCSGEAFSRMLSAGTHLLHLTNLEGGNHDSGSVAAVARVVVTTDPGYVPP